MYHGARARGGCYTIGIVGRWVFLSAGLLAALLLGGGVGLWFAFRLPPPLPASKRGALLSRVTIVVPGEARVAERSIIIRGGKIANILPAVARESDALAGAYALPGLVDAHVHLPPRGLPGQTALHAFLFLRHGVTALRSAGDRYGGESAAMRAGVQRGDFAGPRVSACGGPLGGAARWPNAQVLRTPRAARAAVQRVAAAGFDCVKVQEDLAPDVLAAIRRAARELRLPVMGPAPHRVKWGDAVLDDIQHLLGFAPEASTPARGGHASCAAVSLAGFERVGAPLIMQRAGGALWSGMAITPILISRERLRADAPANARPEAALLPPWFARAFWRRAVCAAPEDDALWARAIERSRRAVRLLHSAGVALHTGTDAGAAEALGVVPGRSLHRELQLFVEAGLSPEQALAASTGASARALGIPALGQIRPGAPADLALFRKDPSRDLANLRTLLAVVADGRLYHRAELDAQLARYQRRYGQFGPRVAARAAAPLLAP